MPALEKMPIQVDAFTALSVIASRWGASGHPAQLGKDGHGFSGNAGVFDALEVAAL